MKLSFQSDSFVILQIADTQDGAKISPDTLDLMDAAIERTKPDLVVFSGDQIWGKQNFRGSREKVEKALRALLAPVLSRNIPFTVCFGNHDRQVGLSNDEQLKIYQSFPNCVAEDTPGIDGTANHCIEICDGEKPVFLLYLLDSHTGLKTGGYDCVHQNQIDWYKKVRDGYEKQCGHVLPSVVIQHIPLCEVFALLQEVKKSTKGAVQGFRTHAGRWYVLRRDRVNMEGFMRESPADPQENSGEFAAFKEKGDVLGVARLAGIMGAKKNAELIPLCHILNLSKVMIEFEYIEAACEIEARCTAKTVGKTGVEMEALTGVQVALLTIYDMCKAVDKGMCMKNIRLLEKTGGKSGVWKAGQEKDI